MLKIAEPPFECYAIGLHIDKTVAASGAIITRRTLLAEQMYRYRYQSEAALLQTIVSHFVNAVKTLSLESRERFNGVILVPPPIARKDFGPVGALAKEISRQTGIVLLQFAVRDCTPAPDTRIRTFAFSSTAASTLFAGKRVLVIDDIYRSGRSLGGFCRLLMEEGKALKVTALVGSVVKKE